MNAFHRPLVSEPGAGRMAHGFGPHLIRMSAAESGGAFGMFEADVPAGEGPPLHVHDREDEFFRVLSGRFLFVCGDLRTELTEGGCVLLPRGVPHRFENVGTATGRLMIIVTPGGFEGFFAAIEEARPAGAADVDRVAARYGLRFVTEAVAPRAA